MTVAPARCANVEPNLADRNQCQREGDRHDQPGARERTHRQPISIIVERAFEKAGADLGDDRIDVNVGGMSKPLGAEVLRLFETAPRLEDSPYVVPSIFDPDKPMPKHTYSSGWRRIIERAGVPHCGTHAVRHRAATDIANSGVPVKVGMALTAHKTVTMFMRYVHAEDDPIREAADTVAALGGGPPFHKFGKFVRYAVADLEAWTAERRHHRTGGDNSRVY